MTSPATRPDDTRSSVSLLVSLRNDAPNVAELHQLVLTCLGPSSLDWEVLYLDEGSTDNTLRELESVAAGDPRVKILSLRRAGRTPCLGAGLAHASGDWIVTLDRRSQGALRDLPNLLADVPPSCDLIVGRRRDPLPSIRSRLDKLGGRLACRILSGAALYDFGCEFRCARRSMLRELRPPDLMDRYLPILAAYQGFEVTEIPVYPGPLILNGPDRCRGPFRTMVDLLAVAFHCHFRSSPFHLFGGIGLPVFGVGLLLTAIAILQWMTGGKATALPYTLILTAIGLQTTLFGLLAELLVHDQSDSEIASVERLLDHREVVDSGERHTTTSEEAVAIRREEVAQ